MAESNRYPILELDSTYISSGSAANISNLSNLMYAELEHLIKKFGEESFLPLVKLVKNTFESLYESDKQKEAILRELEVLEHDHTMLLSKQQAEKNELKILEEHTCELEDSLQEKMKKIESLQSSLCSMKKIYEMKLQNMRDYISRLEEQDREHQNNYANLHSRYKELLNVNLDLTERIRICNEEGDVKIPSSSWNKGQVLSTDFEPTSSTMVVTNPLMLVSHKGDSPYEWGVHRRLHGNAFSEITLDADGSPFSKLSADDNCDEVSNSEEKSESGDFGGCASPIQRENNANEFNAIKEVNKLVNDCNEKDCRINALNVVINDLATNLDELAIEKEQLKETLSQMQICRSSMQLHIKQLDEENTRLKKELADLKALQRQMALNETPFSRRRNFTREEMAKVLMDRIQLQEDFDDLREKYSSALNSERRRNASDKMHAENSPFLNFFSRLFKRQRPLAPRVSFDPSNSDISIDFSGTRAFDPDLVNSSRDRRLNRSDAVNVASCNQWWIPVPIIGRPCEPEPVVMQSTVSLRRRQSTPQSPLRGGGNCLPPPLPQHLYLRPISEALSNEMRLICCTCLYSNVGGLLPSGEQIAGRSTFFTPQPSDPSSSSASTGSVSEPLSSQLWMCLVGVVGTAVVTATKVDPAAGVPSSSSSPSSGVKVECRPSFRSQVVVVDVNKPSRYVDSFCLQRSVVACMATIPARERDYDVLRLSRNTWESIPFAVPNSTEENSIENNPDTSQPSTSRPATAEIDLDEEEEDEEHPASIQTNNTLSSLRHFAETAGKDAVGERLFKVLKGQQIREKSATLSSNSTTANVSVRTSAFDPDLVLEGNPADFYRVERQKFKKITPSSNQSRTFVDDSDMMPSASAQQTVWIGCQNGDIFIHSCDSAQRRPLQSTRLPAGVTAIRHFSGRVFVSLADGHIVVFRRQIRRPEAISGDGHTSPPLPPLRASSPIPPDSDVRISSTSQNQLSIDEELTEAVTAAGVWDLSEAVVIRCAPSGQSPIKSLTVVPPALTIWAGIRNRVLVIDATTFQRLYAFDVVSKSSATVRQLCFCRDGVWISLRDEHSLHLFNAFTYELMQVVDMAYVINETVGAPDSHLLTVSSSVTALEASADHLWIGTKGGHVACMPFKRHSPSKQVSLNTSKTSSASYSTENGNQEDASPPTSQVDLSGASVSGYGHKEAVNFFGIVGGDPSACSTASATSSSTSARLPSTSNSGLFMISGGVGLVEHDRVSNSSLARVKENVEKPASKLQNHLLVWSLPSMGDPSKPH